MSSGSYRITMATRGSTLDPHERWLLTCIAMYSGEDGACTASNLTLANDTGFTEKTVRRVLDALVSKGAVGRERFSAKRIARLRVDLEQVRALRSPRPNGSVTVTEAEANTEDPPFGHHDRSVRSPRPNGSVTVTDDPFSRSAIRSAVSPPPPPGGGGGRQTDPDLEAWAEAAVTSELEALAREPTVEDLGDVATCAEADIVAGMLAELRRARELELETWRQRYAKGHRYALRHLFKRPDCPASVREKDVVHVVKRVARSFRDPPRNRVLPLLHVHHQHEVEPQHADADVPKLPGISGPGLGAHVLDRSSARRGDPEPRRAHL